MSPAGFLPDRGIGLLRPGDRADVLVLDGSPGVRDVLHEADPSAPDPPPRRMLADEDGQGETMPTSGNREQPRRTGAARTSRALIAIKVVHTLVWLSVESCVAYLLYAGFAKRSDRRAAIAGAVVVTECAVFIANGLRCPLTDVAESLGDDHGSVTDIYLPPWLARNLPAIHVPLVILTIVLHLGNLRRRASRTTNAATPARTFRAGAGPLPPPGVARPDPVHCCTRRA